MAPATTATIMIMRRLYALMATIPIIPTLARRTVTTDRSGSLAACLLALGRGSMDSAEAIGAVATTDEDITAVAVTTVEADTTDVAVTDAEVMRTVDTAM